MLCKILAFLMLPCLVISSKMDMKPAFEDLNGTFDGNPEPMDPNLPGLDDLAIISDLDGASRLESNSLELRQSQGCNDNYPASSQCPSWASWACNSAQYANWMANNCKKSCNLCASSCTDNYPASSQCPSWASWACNSAVYANWMADNCKKSCNLCGGGAGQTCSNIPTWMKNAINFNGKIVGGMTAPSPIPWQVQVRTSSSGIFCGGTILDEYTILSAAHCKILSNEIIVAGAKSSQPGPQTIQVKNVINHPSYDSNTHDNDISIVKLKTPLTFNNNVKSACLPEASFLPQSQAAVSGWGTTIDGDPNSASTWLKYVVVPFIPNNQCVMPHTNYPLNDITSNMVCAGYLSGGRDSCQGDSGGPLVVPKSSSDDTAIIYGVVSWGIGCAKPKQPGVYTRVTNYLAWIKANME